jgi:hypothetical protein
MWKLVCSVVDVIFEFGNPKRKTRKVFKNIALFKTFTNIFFANKKIEK